MQEKTASPATVTLILPTSMPTVPIPLPSPWATTRRRRLPGPWSITPAILPWRVSST